MLHYTYKVDGQTNQCDIVYSCICVFFKAVTADWRSGPRGRYPEIQVRWVRIVVVVVFSSSLIVTHTPCNITGMCTYLKGSLLQQSNVFIVGHPGKNIDILF